jgi:hypothetical protein
MKSLRYRIIAASAALGLALGFAASFATDAEAEIPTCGSPRENPPMRIGTTATAIPAVKKWDRDWIIVCVDPGNTGTPYVRCTMDGSSTVAAADIVDAGTNPDTGAIILTPVGQGTAYMDKYPGTNCWKFYTGKYGTVKCAASAASTMITSTECSAIR